VKSTGSKRSSPPSNARSRSCNAPSCAVASPPDFTAGNCQIVRASFTNVNATSGNASSKVVAPLAHAEVGMKHADAAAKARLELAHDLAAERDLGHQHQRLPAGLARRRRGPQVDFGLAAGRHAVQHERREAAARDRGCERRQRRALVGRERARRRGFLPQDSVDHFPATVLETALVGRHPHLARWQWESAADIDRARAALSTFGLAGLDDRDARTLSGGERRRLALAALVAQDSGLLLLDEPSSHLDLGAQVAALDTVAALARNQGKAIVMVLHDLHLALRYSDHAIALGGGSARTGIAGDILTGATLSELFGHRLLAVGEGATRTFLPS